MLRERAGIWVVWDVGGWESGRDRRRWWGCWRLKRGGREAVKMTEMAWISCRDLREIVSLSSVI